MVIRYASIGRVLLALVLIAIAPTRRDDPEVVRAFGYLVAFGWLGAVGVLDLVRRRHGATRGIQIITLLWDVALFGAADAVLHAPATAAAGLVIVVAFQAYAEGQRFGGVAVLLAAAVLTLVPALQHRDIYWSLIATNITVAALLVLLLTEATHRQARARAGLVRVTEKADAILAGIGDAVLVTNHRGRVVEWNHAAERTFACSSDDVLGKHCNELLGLRYEMRDLRCDRGCALLELAPAGTDVEVWRTDAHDRRQPLLATVQPVVAVDGVPIEVIHSFRDITAIKAADEAKTLFLATASHELKTPLTVIRGYAQMLQRDEIDPSFALAEADRHAALVAIETRAHQLAGIVDRLLMSSRIEAGRIELRPEPTDMGPILTERAAAVEGATGHRVLTDLPADLPLVHADADALTTILDHLLDNAAKYSPKGGDITVSARRLDDRVVVRVRDQGIGMTPDQLDQCFKRFWQAESADARRFGGSGIGLYIVRSLTEALEGEVDVASVAGGGSTFSILLYVAGRMPARVVDEEPADTDGEASMIREFMRQMGLRLDKATTPIGSPR
jgi:PAS domain S-box-containing protein